MGKTISELILEYFKIHPNKNLPHGPVVDWVTEQWLKKHRTPPRDPWRGIRKLHQEGTLIKSLIEPKVLVIDTSFFFNLYINNALIEFSYLPISCI